MRRYIVLLILILGFVEVHAQQSILEEINTNLAGDSGQVTKDEPTHDTTRIVNNGSENDSIDSVEQQKEKHEDSLDNPVNEDRVMTQDTQRFKERMVGAKHPGMSKKLQSEADWSKQMRIRNYLPYDEEHMLDTAYEVFGWHPYWCGDAYKSYNFTLLSMVSYFSYEVDPETGFYSSIHNWRETALIDSAKKYDSKVLLTISNFGADNNRKLLRSTEAKKNLIATAITLIREREANGLTLDFENVSKSEKDLYINFIIDLATNLRQEEEDYILTLALPAVDFEKVYAFEEINQYVDYFIMMGYEYHGENSKLAGPIAPLNNGSKWKGFNLAGSVDEYLANGLPSKKFLMGIPYYGAEWITQDLKFPSIAKDFIKYHSYRQTQRLTGENGGKVDNGSLSKFHAYSDMSYNYRQLWYEDSVTLAAKYDWVKDNKIGGIGIWALGYDNGHNELWKLLANKFAYSDEKKKKIQRSQNRISLRRLKPYIKRFAKNPMSVIKRPRSFLRLFGVFTGLSVAGFFIIFRYSRKFKRLFRLVLKGGISAIALVTIASVFIFLRYFELREILFLIGGFVIGGILFLLFSRRYISEKDLP
ncbi:MAG: glycosyl hydrolase family 18 protein [Bacteroidota bacterium]